VAFDLAAILLAAFYLSVDNSPDALPTLCRFSGDVITFTSLLHLGYASYINTHYYKGRRAIVFGVLIGIFYGGLHLISPFLPNIAAYYKSPELDTKLSVILSFSAAISKLGIVYFAISITSLENQTLIRLRGKLRKSVQDREVFFSRVGILEAIGEAFRADSVELYIKVPSVRKASEPPQAHLYSFSREAHGTDGSAAAVSPSSAQSLRSEYETVNESETPLPEVLNRLLEEQKVGRHETEQRRVALFNRLFQEGGTRRKHRPFDGIEPIRYHGGLIGCLKIVRKKNGKFTYSAEKLSQILSQDISVLVHFYRSRVSLRVLVEGLNKNLEMPSQKDSSAPFLVQLNKRFEEVIQQVLSPLKTRFVVNMGFVNSDVPEDIESVEANGDTQNRVPVVYECLVERVGGDLSVGHIRLDYQKDRDPLDKPSLGWFRPYGEGVVSIVGRFFLSSVEQKFSSIIRSLSFELTKKQTFESSFTQIQKSVKEAGLEGVVLYHPEVRGFQQIIRNNDTAANKSVGERLAKAFPEAEELLEQLDDTRPTIVPRVAGGLIIGLKLTLSDSVFSGGLFVEVTRAEFARELGLDTPWSAFLIDLAGVTRNALERIMKAEQLQRQQRERAEDHRVIETAEKINFLTHELINRVENLAGNGALLNFDVSRLELADSLKHPIQLRAEKVRREFDELREVMQGIHHIARIPDESGPSSLREILDNLIRLYETGSNIEIRFEGVRKRSDSGESWQPDIKVNLPAFTLELTLGNLIRNSIASIKRKARGRGNGAGASKAQSLIKIWAEEEERFISCYVNDTGAGVPPSIRESIFDLNVSTKPGKGGWGLFYVKRALERNRGSIELLDWEPGNTTFRVRLPKYSK
jgi:signal transduction histidine kinase